MAARNMTWPEANARVRELNRARYLGHDDWRLPAAEEVVTLAESVQFFTPPSRLAPGVFGPAESLWLADQDAVGQRAHVFATRAGTLWNTTFPFEDQNGVKLVRSAR
jgi:hypothetical protein